MKLFLAPASPYVRKIMTLMHEKGLADRIEKIEVSPNPLVRIAQFAPHNPLGKVPCLVLDDGRALFDSGVIGAYVDGLALPHMTPDDVPLRYDSITLEALADGLLDAAILVRYETTL